MESVASSYGLALFELAKEDHDLDGYKKDLDFVLTALNEEHLRFFNQAMIASEERLAIIERCFKESVRTNVLNFLKLLIVKGRITHLKEIAGQFYASYNAERNIVEGIVYSAMPLSQAEHQKIEAAVSQREGKTVVLKARLDASLIGGVKVVIGDHVLDGSLKNKLDSLQSELMKGSR